MIKSKAGRGGYIPRAQNKNISLQFTADVERRKMNIVHIRNGGNRIWAN